MSAPQDSPHRRQSAAEEVANSVSHGIGLLAAAVMTPYLLSTAMERGGTAGVVGAAIFAATVLLLYTTSTLYHALPHNRAKPVLQVIDHSAIFLLIAGTYTPFTLGVLRGPWGWTLFGIVWGLALAGVLLKGFRGTRHPRLSIALYLLTGWVVIVAIKPLWEALPGWGLFWLVAGGLAYTAGVIFFASDGRGRYRHLVWHLFVLAGTACHYVAVLYYA